MMAAPPDPCPTNRTGRVDARARTRRKPAKAAMERLVPTEGGGRKAEPELDRLSNIIRSFNDLFGNIGWEDGDRIRDLIATEIPNKVAANVAYQNAKQNSDKQSARIEHDRALANVIIGLMKDDTELFKQFSDNPEFKRWLADTIFSATYDWPPGIAS